jgi:hypothetical protein
VVVRVERRKLAFAVLALGALLAGVFLALPRIHGYEVHCEPEPTAERVAGGGWWAVRGSQGEGSSAYNATDDTTLIVPGCGHGDAGLAMRVEGDLRWFGAEDDRLVLSGRGVTGETSPLPARSAEDGQGQPPLQLLDGTFEVRTLWGHVVAEAAGLLALACGLGMLRATSRSAPWSFPLAALVGVVLAHLLWRNVDGLLIFFIGLPLFGFAPGAVGLFGWIPFRGRVRTGFFVALAYAVAFWITFVSFSGAYPLAPDA